MSPDDRAAAALAGLVPSFTEISWCHLTFNPWSGCAKISAGCANCYAAATPAPRRRHAIWGPGQERILAADSYWAKPLRWNRIATDAGVRLRVFVASMADVFETRSDLDPWRIRLWELINATPQLDWLLLTKRPETMLEWSRAHPWPSNAWAGTSVETQAVAEPRIRALLSVPAKVRFLSCEPLLGPLDFSRMACDPIGSGFALMDGLGLVDGEGPPGIGWVIVGGESGKNARPMHPAWVRSIRDQVVEAGAAFHFKQWGEWVPREIGDDDPFDTLAPHNCDRLIAMDGLPHCTWGPAGSDAVPMSMWGKAVAGRHLDGELHDGFPTPSED